MKKLVVSILAVFYLASAVGATVHLHYCMDKLINWSLTKADGDKCDKCGMKKDGGCCKDELKLVKNNTDQKTAEAIQIPQFVTNESQPPFINTSEFYFSFSIIKKLVSHAPPISSDDDKLIRICVLRI